MERRVLKNNQGLTLVEVLIAMVVFLLVSLAMMQTALVGIDSNMTNLLREEAVNIAEGRMNEARNVAFDQLVDDSADPDLNADDCPVEFMNMFGTTGESIKKNFNNISKRFCTNRDVEPLGENNNQVTITVGWKWKGKDYMHRITTIMRSQ